MKTISRRQFLGTTAMGMAAAGYLAQGAAELRADPFGWPIGCQTWPVREAIGKNFEGTLRQLAAEGYKAIEMCSPPSYADSGFGPLVGLKASEMRERIHAAGMVCESCHYGFKELKENLDERMAYAKELGLKQMVVSTFALRRGATMDDWMRAANEMNKLGERAQKAEMQLGFHNHDFEFEKIDGQLIYDKLLSELDPHAVKLQFQVAVVRLGYNAADYFEKYPGRFISMHLADWSPEKKEQVPVGQGVVDWKKTFAAAKTGGVKNYFLEMDPELMKASVPYLHGLS